MAKRSPVRRPYEVIQARVSCQSARGGVWPPRLIVLHDTESHDRAGISDLQGLVNYFDQPSTQASSHVIVDGEGHSARCVSDSEKAWHCMDFNSISLGIEQIGFATFTQAIWSRRKRTQLRKTAQYIAYWSHSYGIPIQRAVVGVGGAVHRSGITTHAALGASGGGHHDPGKGYPLALVLRMANYYKKYGWPR